MTGTRLALWFAIVGAAARSASAQGAGCSFPLEWTNATSWTGTFTLTGSGTGNLPPNGSYAVSQTVTGTITLDQHKPLEDTFRGSVQFTVAAHEHIEVPTSSGPPTPFDLIANASFQPGDPQDSAVLSFDFLNCTYYFYIRPQVVEGTLNGNLFGYLLGPKLDTPQPDLINPYYFALPLGSAPTFSVTASYGAPTDFLSSFTSNPVDWSASFDLTPKGCAPLQVPMLKQTAVPWKFDTYDKAFFGPSRAFVLGTAVDLLQFPHLTSQGNPSAANVIHLDVSANPTMSGVAAALEAAGVQSIVDPPNRYHPNGSVLTLDNQMPLNSVQLLTTPGDPKTNLMRRINDLGCFMTSATMVLDYFASALVANPRQTNDWLNDQPAGFVGSNLVNNYEMARFGRSKGAQMSYAGGSDQNNDADIEAYLCSGNPVMLKVAACERRDPNACGHFVVATGKTVSNVRRELVWTINDPAFNCADLGSNAPGCFYGGTYSGYRKWIGPNGGPASKSRIAAAAGDESALAITGTPSVLLTITDPSGAQMQCGLGVPIPGPGIPNASCTTASTSNDDDLDAGETTPPTTVFEVPQPAAGTYRVTALATDPGSYTVAAVAYDTGGNVSQASIGAMGPTTVPAAFTVAYSPAPDAGVVMTGPPAVADAGSDAGAADAGSGDDAGAASDAGAGDGGSSASDAGSSANDAGGGGSTSPPPAGKGGCGTQGAGLAALIGLLALALRGARRARLSERISLRGLRVKDAVVNHARVSRPANPTEDLSERT